MIILFSLLFFITKFRKTRSLRYEAGRSYTCNEGIVTAIILKLIVLQRVETWRQTIPKFVLGWQGWRICNCSCVYRNAFQTEHVVMNILSLIIFVIHGRYCLKKKKLRQCRWVSLPKVSGCWDKREVCFYWLSVCKRDSVLVNSRL